MVGQNLYYLLKAVDNDDIPINGNKQVVVISFGCHFFKNIINKSCVAGDFANGHKEH